MNAQTIGRQDTAVMAIVREALKPLQTSSQRERIARWAGAGLSLAILAAVGTAIGSFDLSQMVRRVPTSPLFWCAFAAAYLLPPLSEWMIYRRIWKLPLSGIAPLLQKQVANEILLGYSGEAQFYLWARRNTRLTGSPFGAIKDVAVLSALAGNLATLVMMAAMAPLLSTIITGAAAKTFAVSVLFVAGSSIALFALRGRLFSLPSRTLRAIFALHSARIAISIAVTAGIWSLILPGVAFHWWLALATLRLMLSRLPLLPNKDVLFSGLTLMLLGRDAQVTGAMAVMASLMLATHLVVGVATAGFGLMTKGRRAPR